MDIRYLNVGSLIVDRGSLIGIEPRASAKAALSISDLGLRISDWERTRSLPRPVVTSGKKRPLPFGNGLKSFLTIIALELDTSTKPNCTRPLPENGQVIERVSKRRKRSCMLCLIICNR